MLKERYQPFFFIRLVALSVDIKFNEDKRYARYKLSDKHIVVPKVLECNELNLGMYLVV